MTSLAIIDLSSIWHQTWHATADMELNEAYRRTLDKVHTCASDHDFVAVCIDSPPYKRSEILPGYKGHREKPSEVFVDQFRRAKETLAKRYAVLGADGYEADDCISAVCAQTSNRVDEVFIYSGDKDLMQLVDDRTTVVSVQTGDSFGPDRVEEKFGVGPEHMAELLALWGDKADNVPGVPGIGVKRAADLLNEHGSLANVLTAADNGGVKGKVGEALVEHAHAARTAHVVVLLDSKAPVDVDSIFEERKSNPVETEAVFDDDEVPNDEQPVDNLISAEPVVKQQPEPPAPTHKAIVVSPTENWTLQLEPNNGGSAYKLASLLYESRMFGQFPNPEAILSVVLRGRALGLDSTTSLSNFSVIQGRPVMSAALLIGIVLRSGKAEYLEWVESDAEHATWITKRVGGKSEKRLTWTVDDAVSAGLLHKDPKSPTGYSGKDNWTKWRPAMLRWRCGVELARSVFPDVVAGIYTREEFDE